MKPSDLPNIEWKPCNEFNQCVNGWYYGKIGTKRTKCKKCNGSGVEPVVVVNPLIEDESYPETLKEVRQLQLGKVFDICPVCNQINQFGKWRCRFCNSQAEPKKFLVLPSYVKEGDARRGLRHPSAHEADTSGVPRKLGTNEPLDLSEVLVVPYNGTSSHSSDVCVVKV